MKTKKLKALIEAVKKDSYVYQYVKDDLQTKKVYLEALKQNGDALQFINSNMFKENYCSKCGQKII